jgi:hypothetical protein
MAISQMCSNCGVDLARVRPQRDPHYRLPLVHCPTCAQVTIRRRHPLLQSWRTFRKIDVAVLILGFQFLAAAVAAVTALGFALNIDDIPRMLSDSRDRVVILIFYACICAFTGIWLTIGFRHLKRWQVWCGWSVVLALLSLLILVMFSVDNQMSYDDAVAGKRIMADLATHWPPALLGILLIMIGSAIGIAPGLFAERALAYIRAALWRTRRRRLRAHRSGA